MNISGDYSTSFNFKGVSSDVVANLGKIKPETREQFWKYRDTLEKSSFVDLIWHKDDLALKINKNIKDSILGSKVVLKKGSIIESVRPKLSKQGRFLDLNDVKVIENEKNKKINKLMLNMSSYEDASMIHAKVRRLDMPTLGCLIDMSEKVRPYAEKINEIMSDFIIK